MSESDERVSGSFTTGESPAIGSSPDDPPLILRGGKVNPEAIELAYRRAAESGESDESMRLDKYLTSRITFMSRNQLQHLIGEGGVTVNGTEARPATKLRQGDAVEVVVPPRPRAR
jgi:ribosome-associated protein YbcJ (S4-like RNA binding protein)